MKKFTAILLALMLVLPVMSFSVSAAMPVENSLFAYYSFNEDVSGMIVDGMAKNHGQLLRGAGIVNDAERGSVLSLDGTAAHVKLEDNLLQTLGDVTITIWYKWTDADFRNWARVYDLGNGTQNYYMLTPQSGDGTLRFEAKVADAGILANGDMEHDKWVHVAATVGGGVIKYYINGVLVDEVDCTYKTSEMGATDANFIGRSQFGADPYFAGLVDDMAIYSAVLTEAQIKEVMSAKFSTPDSAKSTVVAPTANPVFNTTPNADGMYARYTLNEIVDGKIIDDINGNNGTIMNGATIANDPVRGNVLYLDGTNQYIHLPDAITKGVKAVTIATWYKWTDSNDSSWSRVWDIGNDTNDNFFLTPRSGNGTIRFATKLSEWGSTEDIFDGPDPIVDEWVHVAAVMGNGNTAFYLNGELIDEYGVDHTPDGLGDSTQNFIGKSQWPDPYFTGYIDDFVLYNKALSAADIKKLMDTDNKNIVAAVTVPAEVAPPAVVDTPEAQAEAVAAPAPVAAAPQTPSPAPQTGDTTIILVAVCVVAVIAGVVFLRIRKAKAR